MINCITGNKKSYGDLKDCSSGATELNITKSYNKFISFEKDESLLEVGGGTLLSDVLSLARKGFIPEVLPGTSQISIGGAIANDVHGKNQQSSGSFGNCVEELHLIRSDGNYVLTPKEPLFQATIGGLGCTGLIKSAKIRLKKIDSLFVEVAQFRFVGLEQYLELDVLLKKHYEYTVAWIDVNDKKLHGVYFAGNHLSLNKIIKRNDFEALNSKANVFLERLSSPITLPNLTVNLLPRINIDLMRKGYYFVNKNNPSKVKDIGSFFFPLDKISNFQAAYGKGGLSQYQINVNEAPMSKWQSFFDLVRKSGNASFIAVLKSFGEKHTPAKMTFAIKGLSCAIDFKGNYEKNYNLFCALDQVFEGEQICWYPAKDGHINKEKFVQSMGIDNVNFWKEHWDRQYLGSKWFNRVFGDEL